MFRGILITKDDAGYKAQLQNIDDSVLPEGMSRSVWNGRH